MATTKPAIRLKLGGKYVYLASYVNGQGMRMKDQRIVVTLMAMSGIWAMVRRPSSMPFVAELKRIVEMTEADKEPK